MDAISLEYAQHAEKSSGETYMMTSFAKQYKEQAIPALQERFGYKNIHAVPRMTRIVINVGIGKLVNAKGEDAAKNIIEALAFVSGQRPTLIRSRKSIAGFKLRQGSVNGVKVTLRRGRMEDFFQRFVHIALPRTRDFRGVKRSSVDESGNCSVGVRESVIFPEIVESNAQFSLEVTFVTSAKTRDEGLLLLEKLGLPFEKTE